MLRDCHSSDYCHDLRDLLLNWMLHRSEWRWEQHRRCACWSKKIELCLDRKNSEILYWCRRAAVSLLPGCIHTCIFCQDQCLLQHKKFSWICWPENVARQFPQRTGTQPQSSKLFSRQIFCSGFYCAPWSLWDQSRTPHQSRCYLSH